MEKENINLAFVVLMYRNADDLSPFVNNLKNSISETYRVIVVNSFYDNESEQKIKEIAKEYKCDYISVENKGYGSGNNRGIEFANKTYQYDFLIVCNSDLVIKKWSYSDLKENKNALLGPMIITKNGKKQNPYWVRENKFTEKLLYLGRKKNKRMRMIFSYGINKIDRELFVRSFLHSKKASRSVFAVHGSFVIYPREVLEQIGNPYDENMFLFSEEAYLAHRLKKEGIATRLLKNIEIVHFEDGSSQGIDTNTYSNASGLYYYETYVLGINDHHSSNL